MGYDRRHNKPPYGTEPNPYSDMGFVKFWLVSTAFYLTFPLSLGLAFLALGPVRTKQLVQALVHDFLQTILILIGVLALAGWLAYHYLSGLFGG